jgi:hypothetical protein
MDLALSLSPAALSLSPCEFLLNEPERLHATLGGSSSTLVDPTKLWLRVLVLQPNYRRSFADDPSWHHRASLAVRSLEQGRHDGNAIAGHIVALSTYLGL